MDKINVFLIIYFIQLVENFNNQDICGQSLVGPVDWRIINGQDARVGEFPWHVLITLRNGSHANDTEPNFCGGTLINDQWVLTAGHCIKEYARFDLNATVLEVRLGVHNLSVTEEKEIDVLIEKVILKENYNESTFKYKDDIALLKMIAKLDYNGKHKHLRPICLAESQTKLTDKCVAIGFGLTDLNHSHPVDGILQKVNQNILQDERCVNQYPGQYDGRVQICIAGNETGPAQFACPGDSGSPAQCRGSDGKWYQVGIVSFATGGCKSQNHNPVVFTRISAYIDWIGSAIEENKLI